jgi:hypothetical protein
LHVVYSSAETSSTTYSKPILRQSSIQVDGKASLSCLSHTGMEDVIEFVKAPADDHSRNQLTSVSQLRLLKDYKLRVPNFAIKHWWFSGKIGRCHPRSPDLRCRPAPGSIPGRCMSISPRHWSVPFALPIGLWFRRPFTM